LSKSASLEEISLKPRVWMEKDKRRRQMQEGFTGSVPLGKCFLEVSNKKRWTIFFEEEYFMTSEIICIFNRNSKCIFKGGLCDQDCDRGTWEENNRSHENLSAERLEEGDGKLAFTRKVANLLRPFP
jgi:hypothetical protein